MSQAMLADAGYDVIRHLGEGTMGSVYLVKRKSDGKELVLKKLIITSTSGLDETSAREIFRRESELLKRFSHPGLPEIYDTFIQNGQDYLVMEYIKGETLEDIINKHDGPFTSDKALKWVIEIAEILDYLHNSFEAPVIYKDLKPSNIIITPDGSPRLVDFGTSRYYSPDKNSDTHRLGTPGYAAPEQYNKNGQTTPQSDLFALGVILFQLLTKYDPTVTPLKFPSMKSLNPFVPERLEEIIKKAIQPEPVKRYISVVEFKESLEKYMGIKKSSYFSLNISETDHSSIKNYKNLIMPVRQLAIMVGSGCTIMSCLNFLYEERAYKNLRKTISTVKKEVETGSSLHKALSTVPDIFSPSFINMIKAGEREANLKYALEKISDLMEVDLKLQKKVHTAILVPLTLLSMAAITILFIIMFALPIFVELFDGMDLALPLPTKIVLTITKTIKNQANIKTFIVLLAGTIAVCKCRNKRIFYDRIKLYLPVLGPLYKKMAVSRFCRAAGTLISSNIPLMEALSIAIKATGNRFLSKKIEENSKDGEIAFSVAGAIFLPTVIFELIKTEKNNKKLGETLCKLSDDYNSEMEITLNRLLPLTEGFLIVVTVLIIFFFITNIFLPGYSPT